jgi:Na+/proline symporter
MFITIVMTGLDQDLMQKNLSCKNIGEAKKNMYWFSIILVGVNFLFLSVGALLFIYAQQKGIAIPAVSDQFYPSLALNHLGLAVGVFFLLGIIASSYASSDSALTALTTSFCIDFLDFANKDEKLKQKQRLWVHVGFSVLFFLIIVIFKYINQKAIIDVVLGAASFTYGPLLGMFAYGIFTHKKVKDVYVPIVVLVAPILTYVLYIHSQEWLWGYQFAFEHLLINGLLTMLGLYLIQEKK